MITNNLQFNSKTMKEVKPAKGGSARAERRGGGNSDFDQDYFLFFLSKIKGLGPRLIMALLKELGGLENIYQLLPKGASSNNKKLALIAKCWADNNFVQQTRSEFDKINDHYISILETDYPPLLKNIYDPPLFLYYRGNKEILKSQHLLTLIGSRKTTNYHQAITKELIAGLAQTPLIIVSGLARGIDALSHLAALENGLGTIAVLGSDLNDKNIYPPEHLNLARQIVASGGLLLSECPQPSPVQRYNFPRRNRILAGLSRATIVISGNRKSGTLITAQVAIDEGREVLAVPGNINNELNLGPNALIASGAALISSADDILKVYGLNKKISPTNPLHFTDALEAKIYQAIRYEPLTAEEISNKILLPLATTSATIAKLELKNIVKTNQYNQIEIN